MRKEEYLSVYDLCLTARAPLHVGSGAVCAKTDYLYDARAETARMIDPDALFCWLYENRLAGDYERFVFSGSTRLDFFLRDHRVTARDLDALCLYTVNVADALDENHSLKEIHAHVRDSRHRVYVPGSSVKGALRTVILAAMIAQEKRGVWPNAPQKFERARQMQKLEGNYLNTLPLKRGENGRTANDPVNSVLRGVSVSDSAPVSDADVILVGKVDANEKGEYKKLPLCRECIRPGTALHFRLTLDHSILPPDCTADKLMQMIRDFDDFYQRTYLSRFQPPVRAQSVSFDDALILGGGAGFFAKTLAYPYLGTQKGMQYTEGIMKAQFPKHGHEWDVSEHHVSPHMMKYGWYQGKLYPYGVCGVALQ